MDLSAVHSIEAAVLSATPEEIGIQGDFYPFQLGYVSDDYYILYLVALNDPERTDWIQTLRRGKSAAKQSVGFAKWKPPVVS